MPPCPQLTTAPFGRATGYDMLIKISLLLLVALAVLGVFFRTRFPPSVGTQKKSRIAARAKTCPDCGRHQIGKADCTCGKEA